MNSIYCHCEFDEDNFTIIIEIINNINGSNYKRILNNIDIGNIEFIYNKEEKMIKKKILDNGYEEIKIINFDNNEICNIRDLYHLIQNKNFKISLFDDFAVIENTNVVNFNITINNINKKNKNYIMDYFNKIENCILNGYKETHIYKNYIYKTCYLKNVINIELVIDNIKYSKNLFETDLDNIFDFENYSLNDYYILILYYIKNNRIIIVDFLESNQIEIIFDKNLKYHIFLESYKKNTLITNTKNKELFVKIEKDLEEFKNYLDTNKNDSNLLIEIERKINYRINKLKMESDYVFL